MLPFTLQQLRILKAVITEKSFTKAAKVCFYHNHI
jgi:DNA-binding transcriptional LysR family regulator